MFPYFLNKEETRVYIFYKVKSKQLLTKFKNNTNIALVLDQKHIYVVHIYYIDKIQLLVLGQK